MKKKKKMHICLMLLVITSLFIGIHSIAESNFPYKKWGKKLSEYYQSEKDDKPYAVGKNGVITVNEIELSKYCYKLQGLNDEEAEKAALRDCMKREATYQKACKEGYSATEQEIWDFLNQSKSLVEKSVNSGEFKQIISQFDSEQDFWNFQYTIYEKDLVIIKFIQDYEKAFDRRNSYKNDQERANAWSACYEQLRNDLVQEEDFKIVYNN